MKKNKHSLKLSTIILNKCKNKFLIQNELEEKGSAQEIFEISDELFNHLYTIANQFLKEQKYSDAANAFLFLATLAHNQASCWIGFGMATQCLEDFDNAIDAYEIAAACEIENPLPYLYLAKAFFALHQRERAKEAIELALLYAGDKAEYKHIKDEALRAQQHLEKHEKS